MTGLIGEDLKAPESFRVGGATRKNWDPNKTYCRVKFLLSNHFGVLAQGTFQALSLDFALAFTEHVQYTVVKVVLQYNLAYFL
jgi:hypothetical protein